MMYGEISIAYTTVNNKIGILKIRHIFVFLSINLKDKPDQEPVNTTTRDLDLI